MRKKSGPYRGFGYLSLFSDPKVGNDQEIKMSPKVFKAVFRKLLVMGFLNLFLQKCIKHFVYGTFINNHQYCFLVKIQG